LQDAHKAEQEALKTESSNIMNIKEQADNQNSSLGLDGGNKRLLSAAMGTISSTLATAIAAAAATTQSVRVRLGGVNTSVEMENNTPYTQRDNSNNNKNDSEVVINVGDSENYYDEDGVIVGGASANGVPLRALHEICCTHRARVICIGDVHGR